MELMGLEMPCVDCSVTADHMLHQQGTSEPEVKNDHRREVGQEGQFPPPWGRGSEEGITLRGLTPESGQQSVVINTLLLKKGGRILS